MIRLLADVLNVAPRDIQVVRGEISRAKTVQIAGAEDQFRRLLPPQPPPGTQ
mgnify:FL=1